MRPASRGRIRCSPRWTRRKGCLPVGGVAVGQPDCPGRPRFASLPPEPLGPDPPRLGCPRLQLRRCHPEIRVREHPERRGATWRSVVPRCARCPMGIRGPTLRVAGPRRGMTGWTGVSSPGPFPLRAPVPYLARHFRLAGHVVSARLRRRGTAELVPQPCVARPANASAGTRKPGSRQGVMGGGQTSAQLETTRISWLTFDTTEVARHSYSGGRVVPHKANKCLPFRWG